MRGEADGVGECQGKPLESDSLRVGKDVGVV